MFMSVSLQYSEIAQLSLMRFSLSLAWCRFDLISSRKNSKFIFWCIKEILQAHRLNFFPSSCALIFTGLAQQASVVYGHLSAGWKFHPPLKQRVWSTLCQAPRVFPSPFTHWTKSVGMRLACRIGTSGVCVRLASFARALAATSELCATFGSVSTVESGWCHREVRETQREKCEHVLSHNSGRLRELKKKKTQRHINQRLVSVWSTKRQFLGRLHTWSMQTDGIMTSETNTTAGDDQKMTRWNKERIMTTCWGSH